MSTTFATIRSVLLIFQRLAQTEVCRIVFYDVYVKLCEERGEKPYSVPYKLGWSNNSIVKQWSLGSTPRKDKLTQIADYFNVPVAYLLTEDESLLETKKPATEVTGDRRSYAVQMVMDATDEELEDYLNYMEWKKAKKDGEK